MGPPQGYLAAAFLSFNVLLKLKRKEISGKGMFCGGNVFKLNVTSYQGLLCSLVRSLEELPCGQQVDSQGSQKDMPCEFK